MNSRFSITKCLFLFGILILPVYGTTEMAAGAAEAVPKAVANSAGLAAASGAALAAASRAFAAHVSGTTAGVASTLNSGLNSLALRLLDATAAISSIVTGTAVVTDELTLSAADLVDEVISRGCSQINEVAQRTGGIAVSTVKSGTAAIAKEVEQALKEIEAVAQETGEEINSILEASTKLMQSLTKQSINGYAMIDGFYSTLAVLAEHSNNLNQHGIINTMEVGVQTLAHSTP